MKWLAVFLVLAAGIAGGGYYWWEVADIDPLDTGPGYESIAVPLQDHDLFDLGVADVDADGLLDVYTVNHSSLQSLLLNVDGRFESDSLARLGLSQTAAFPGVEDRLTPVVPSRPGLYVYRTPHGLVFLAHGLAADRKVRIHLQVPWKMIVQTDDDVAVENRTSNYDSSIAFELAAGQRVAVKGAADIVELPHRITIASEFPKENVYVGRDGVSPDAHEFTLIWRDRHAMAWSDVDADGRLDVYIARGGVKGSLASIKEPVHDELFVQQSDRRFVDRYAGLGFSKSTCPARQTSWVDINRDGLLDLHVVCARGERSGFHDQMWLRNPDGSFEDVAARIGLDHASMSQGVWFDVDRDADPDYLVYQGGEIRLYVNGEDAFVGKTVLRDADAQIGEFKIADIDNDGDFDSYVVGRQTSFLLLNDGGSLVRASPRDWGLPNRAITANWVDYDNDGRLDLHVVPTGLYRRQASGRFAAIGEMSYIRSPKRTRVGRCTWFDSDNDGDVDAVCGFYYHPSKSVHQFETKVLRRHTSLRSASRHYVSTGAANDNHWLQVELHGADGNREAIGARIRVDAAGQQQLRAVGQFEGARYSQGHYRTYFGLGDAERVDQVGIMWPDGTEQILKGVSVDQLLVVEKQ